MSLVKNEIDQYLIAAQQTTQKTYTQSQLISLLDLTSLNDDDNISVIQNLCQRASTTVGHVAAVCLYPEFVAIAKAALKNTSIKIATVANFPDGNDHLTPAIKSIEQAIQAGANEIDLVMPYHAFLAGNTAIVEKFVYACKEVCSQAITLKVILETGVFPSVDLIYTASRLVIESGADFIKTSTGKSQVNATLEAAIYILLAIKDSGRKIGFKAAGGIRTYAQAISYIKLAELIMGEDWVSSKTFRLGASSLLDTILQN